MENMFYNATQFNVNIKDWDVSNVTNMTGMFYNANNFNRPLAFWDVSNIPSEPAIFDVNANAWSDSWRPIWGTTGYQPVTELPPKYYINMPANWVSYNSFMPANWISYNVNIPE
jgi:surface protein